MIRPGRIRRFRKFPGLQIKNARISKEKSRVVLDGSIPSRKKARGNSVRGRNTSGRSDLEDESAHRSRGVLASASRVLRVQQALLNRKRGKHDFTENAEKPV